MRAITVDRSSSAVELLELPNPRVEQPDHVLLRVLEVGVCGTDREIAAGDYGTPPAGSRRLIIGHECLARVDSCGAEASGMEPDDLVVPMVRRPCPVPTCTPCRSSRPDFCATGQYVERGIRGAHGYLAEMIVVEARYLHTVPEALRHVAVLVEPLTVAEKALAQVELVQQRLPWQCRHAESGRGQGPGCHRALVLGAGPVGLLGAMALLTRGFATFVYSREPAGAHKSALVEAIGADYLSAADHRPKELAGVVGNIDVIYEATGAAPLGLAALGALGTNGVFVFTGVPGRRSPVEIDAARLMREMVLRNQLVLGTVNADDGAFRNAIRDLSVFAARWPEQLAALITGRHPLDAAPGLIARGAGRTRIKDVVVVTTGPEGNTR